MTSFALSDQMRQSSNDLTRMVRLYVTTGEERYRRYYDEILAIRRGEAPRPRRLRLLLLGPRARRGRAGERTGPPRSLQTLMREAGFAAEEFTALNASLAASDALARTEREVMRTRDYDRLVDAAYHAQKGTIMAAIERFTRWSTPAPPSAATRSRTARTACSCCRR